MLLSVVVYKYDEREDLMSKMKAYAMDLEDMVVCAIENGAETVEDVIAHCKTEFVFVDEKYVTDLYDEFCADWMSEAYA